MAEPKIIAQRGDAPISTFLIDAGDPPDANGRETARVYDRRQHRLFGAFAKVSILARGYWLEPSVDDEERLAIAAEVDALL